MTGGTDLDGIARARADGGSGGPLSTVGGEQLLAGLAVAMSWLEANREQIDELNVYPVPDGDTGSNMHLTMRSAVEEAERAQDGSSASAVMAAAARGSLMGARGNSGVILSQLLRGFAQGVGERDEVDVATVARALRCAADVAYRAVMKPTEGTILSVARAAADAAAPAEEEGADIAALLARCVRAAHEAVERTTEQLDILREAGVVDAGGFGLAVILEGLLDGVGSSHRVGRGGAAASRQDPPQVRVPGPAPGPRLEEAGARGGRSPARGAAAVAERAQGWGHCTQFLVHGPGLDAEALREELGGLGESALVVGDAEVVRVHIHTDDPGALISTAARRGRLSNLAVQDMTEQHREAVLAAGAGEREGGDEAASRKEVAVVAVAPGEGFRDIFTGLGADSVVEGGQTMNPSIENLLRAVEAAEARSVILLPNNRNVVLTAEQVDGLAEDVEVHVIPTRNVPQGVTALVAYDAASGVGENVERMTAAAEQVRAVEITTAVRDSVAGGRRIAEGDVIALVDDELTHSGPDCITVIDEVLAGLDEPPELITVYHGAGVSEGEAAELVDELRRRHPAIELEHHRGGQDHYPYVLSLE